MAILTSIETINDISAHPEFHGVITDLRTVIDEYDSKVKKSKELILDLCSRLDREKVCEQNKISQIIKEILKDKIKEGKITAKWIEQCLPTEYKRKYSIKSEESSLSTKKQGLISITNAGKEGKIDDISIQYHKKELTYPVDQSDKIQTYELKEALRKQKQFVSGDQIFSEESVFHIQQEQFQLVNEVLEKSNKPIVAFKC